MRNPLYMLAVALTAFAEGSIALGIQVVAAKLIAPYYGNTIMVWINLLSVAIFSLSAGYISGGLLSSRISHKQLTLMFIFIFVYLIILYLFATPALDFSLKFNPSWGILYSAVVLIFPLLFVCGIISPFLIKLISALNSEYNLRSTGWVFAVSTTGSIAALLFFSLYFMPYYGIKETMLLMAFFSMLATAVLFFLPSENSSDFQ